jgi:hypothetical protein
VVDRLGIREVIGKSIQGGVICGIKHDQIDAGNGGDSLSLSDSPLMLDLDTGSLRLSLALIRPVRMEEPISIIKSSV